MLSTNDLALTRHAAIRAQQRGIPPLIQDWLIGYGEECYVGRGAIVRFFSKRSRRALERAVGSITLRRMGEYLGCYLVEATDDGRVITVGRRDCNAHIWRDSKFHRLSKQSN